ncbi:MULTISPECIES: tRNA threonylcarbamoyladenosine dehydratase [Clostridium]|uniref:tRNA threonylcarbamoyladenosine dehydratase n=2 Tax=Clostridium TaxID=1485 RepID=A0A151AHM0_9CLOT|nr:MULTISPECIES: tRNA threonylcarbamoyladenosine dehydratase [Clostridium]KYH27166.1 tRNA threonylcarbamoyladenosine dehydratase [Clostridium colicanis DSM 13634]MBE6043493.1 tRNA threonylcarbamoyladenosine dehydratase [Clostridium thermopalmarium]PRR71632.1 tRNA threonylcarbamoyladenosine dehydratase [Clostridium thermopalmarium DSM 5974]PVZ15794.1 tRNA A37 threonylcarbamoyladenosine dehydratase [Clostridium thermopalmarium DSM 5974]
MYHWLSRTEKIIGKDNIKKLSNSKVVILGVGGVGGFATEAIARSGIGNIILVDKDQVDITNLNRQIIATRSTIGQDKVEVMKRRILDINPDCNVKTYKVFIGEDNISEIIDSDVDYVIDAIDTVSSKISVAVWCEKQNIKLISSMGTGNKLDPTKLRISDIYKTSICPLAKVMRRELKRRNVKHLKVLYSEEQPIKATIYPEEMDKRKKAPGSTAFVPSVAGLIIASQVVRDLIKEDKINER